MQVTSGPCSQRNITQITSEPYLQRNVTQVTSEPCLQRNVTQVTSEPSSQRSFTQHESQEQCGRINKMKTTCDLIPGKIKSAGQILNNKGEDIKVCLDNTNDNTKTLLQENKLFFTGLLNQTKAMEATYKDTIRTVVHTGFNHINDKVNQGIIQGETLFKKVNETTQHIANETENVGQASENVANEFRDDLSNTTAIANKLGNNITDYMEAQIDDKNQSIIEQGVRNFTKEVMNNIKELFLNKTNPIVEQFNGTKLTVDDAVSALKQTIEKNKNFSLRELIDKTNKRFEEHSIHEIINKTENFQSGVINEEYINWSEKVFFIATVAVGILVCFQKRSLLKEEAELEKEFNNYVTELSKHMVLKNKLFLTNKDGSKVIKNEISKEYLCVLIIKAEKILARLKMLRPNVERIFDN
jgi:hypothetical protein